MYVNARSLVTGNKFHTLEAWVHDLDPDIIGVTESWANSEILDAEISLPGYDLFRKDRPVNRHGGGVLLYVRDKFCAVDCKLSTKFPEQIWCSLINSKRVEMLIGVLYRTPTNDIFGSGNHELLRELLTELSTKNKHFVLMGDFNYRYRQWPPADASEVGPNASHFYDCLEENFFTQHVDMPTRDANILDLVITDEPDLVKDIMDLGFLDTSDHVVLKWKVEFETSPVTNRKMTFDFSKANWAGMKQELQSIDWCDALVNESIEQNWCVFKNRILELQKKYVPVKKNYSKRRKPLWMSHKALKAVVNRRKVYRKYRDSSHPACRKASSLSKKLVEDSRRKFEKELATNIQSDKKSFFAYVNSKSKSKVRVGPLLGVDGQPVVDSGGLCELLNKYFTTVFTKEDNSCNPEPEDIFNECAARLVDISVDEAIIAKRLNNLRVDKSAGVDELCPRLLKELSNDLAGPVAMLFRQSLSEGTVPVDWRSANVTPIFKKGSRQQVENYRPVSLTSVIGKVIESIIRDEIVAHLNKYNLIRDTQHGFRKGRSCASNLLVFLEYITECIDSGDSVDVLYLDFAKAFDKVPHNRLLRKLEAHGVDGMVLGWIRAWLKDRRQRVCVEGVCSVWRWVISGVPQGSVLGPLLFLIFINDLESHLLSQVLKFADDTKVFGVVNNTADHSRLQNDLDVLTEWAAKWQMKFNEDKCKVMHLGRHNEGYDYVMNGQLLQKVESEKDLGITMAEDGKVAGQCLESYAKANRMLGLVKRTIRYRHPKVLINLYKTLVRPHLEYSMTVWNPHYQKDKILLERVQHRFTRLFDDLRDLPYDMRLEKLRLWSLEERRNRGDLIEVFKMVKGYSDVSWQNFFKRSPVNATRGHNWKFQKPHCRRDCRLHFFSLRVISRWNSLSQDLVNSTSVNSFKTGLEKLRQQKMGFFMD